jgi:DNA polymerase
LGATALAAVHRAAGMPKPLDSLTRLVGTSLPLGGRWLVPTFHPSYVLRLPEPAQREAAFARIVDALREAQRLAESSSIDLPGSGGTAAGPA